MSDFATARRMMVDTQVRPSDVTKFPIIDALLTVRREVFVPDNQRDVAYAGEHINLGSDRVIFDARTFAKLLDALDPQQNEMALDIGCGQGYSSAVLARLCDAVIAVEEDAGMASEAERLLSEEAADNVAVVNSPLAQGAAKHGPYDVIVINGAVETIPDSILDQLKDDGRIAAVFLDGHLGEARVGYKTGGRVSWRMAFNAAAPVLSGFDTQEAFAL